MIKTWQSRLDVITDTTYQGYASPEEIDACKQTEIDELRAELGDLPQAQAELLATVKRLQAENAALERGHQALSNDINDYQNTIAALKQQEPVAWQRIDPETNERIWDEDSFSSHPNDLDDCIPLYRAAGAQPAKPLSDDEIDEVIQATDQTWHCDEVTDEWAHRFARAIEAKLKERRRLR